MNDSLPPDLVHAIATAREAAALALDLYGQVERLSKRGDEAVTEADRGCQRLIVERLLARHPADGIIGEENDDGSAITNRPPASGQRVWVIDPIDGTNNYVAGYAGWAPCIGLLDQGVPLLGVVHDAVRNWTYAAAAGHGAWLIVGDEAPRPLRVTSAPVSSNALFMVTCNLFDAQGRLPTWGHRLLSTQPWKLRMIGSAALEAVQVAAGVAHGALTMQGKLWDVAAPAAIVLAAGGEILRFDGTPLFPLDLTGYSGAKTPFLATAPQFSAGLVAELRDHAQPAVLA